MASVLADIAAIAQVVIALALVVIAALVIPLAWRLRRVDRRINGVIDRLQSDVSPVMQHARSIADDVHFVTHSIRDDMARVNETIADANERVERVVALAEDRLNEFNALLAVVQDEAESLFVSTASAVHGVRGGAAAFHERSGTEFASDELDAAATADEIETQEESPDVHDSHAEPAAPTPPPLARNRAEPVPVAGAPRVRPRVGRSHRA